MSDVKSRRALYAGLTREAVITSARDLFARVGYDSTSVDEIAKVAEVSKGAVYHHFGDKHGLFAAVFRASQQEVMQTVAEAVVGVSHPWEQAGAAVSAFLQYYVDNPTARSLLQQSGSALGQRTAHSIDEELALPLMNQLLLELTRRGELRELPLERTATILFGTLCEAATSIAFAEDIPTAAQEAETVVLALVDGLRVGNT